MIKRISATLKGEVAERKSVIGNMNVRASNAL